MKQNKYKLSDFAEAISTAVQDPQSSLYNKFVGLEHYDSGEPVVKRYQSTDILTSACKEFHKNDILIARRNVYLKRAGIAFFDGLTSGDSIVLRVYDNCEEKTGIPYNLVIKTLPFILNSNDFWSYANRHADGMNSKRISKDKVLDYEFTLPPLSEQKALAEKLWAAYEVKQSYLKMIAATEEMVKSQFVEMFGGKPANGTIADLVCKNISNVKKTYGTNDKIEYIDISSINADNHTVEKTTQYTVKDAPSRAQQCVQFGDLLVSTVRPINKNIAIVNLGLKNLVASTGFCVLRPIEGFREYLLSIVLSDDYTNAMCDKANGGVYPAVNNGDVLSYPIHIPNSELASKISSIYNQADKSLFELKKSIAAIDGVIKSLVNEKM